MPSCEITLTIKKEPGVIVPPLYSSLLSKVARISSSDVSNTAFTLASGTPGIFCALAINEVVPELANTESGNVTEPGTTEPTLVEPVPRLVTATPLIVAELSVESLEGAGAFTGVEYLRTTIPDPPFPPKPMGCAPPPPPPPVFAPPSPPNPFGNWE